MHETLRSKCLIARNNEAFAYLTITGEIDPLEITVALGTPPDQFWAKGDVDSSGRRRETSRWSLASDLSESISTEAHIDNVLMRLAHKRDALYAIAKRHRTTIQVVGYYWRSHPGLVLVPEQFSRLADCGLGLDLDLRWLRSDDREDTSEHAEACSTTNRQYAYAWVQGDFEVDTFSKAIDLEPTTRVNIGEPRGNTGRLYNQAAWRLNSSLNDDALLIDHVADVLKRISANEEAFVAATNSLSVGMAMVGHFWQRYPNLTFDKALITSLARFRMTTDLDFYGPYTRLKSTAD
jgi:hypothetical protein